MELYTKCSNCSDFFTIKSTAASRNELEDEIGRNFKKQCPKCLSTKEYHVNDVRAKSAQKQFFIVAGIGILAGVLLAIFLWNQGFISTLALVIPVAVVVIFNSGQKKSIHTFNRYLIKR